MVKTRTMVKYEVWDLDVWGNEQDGFEVNDRSYSRVVEFPTTHEVFNEGTEHEFSTDWPSNRQILETLQKIGFIKTSCTLTELTIDGDPEFGLYIEEIDSGFPLCQLEQVI